MKVEDPQTRHGGGKKLQDASGRAVPEEVGRVDKRGPGGEDAVGKYDRLFPGVAQVQHHSDVAEAAMEAERRQERRLDDTKGSHAPGGGGEFEEVVLVEDGEGDLVELPGDDSELAEDALVEHQEACVVDGSAPRGDRGENEHVLEDHAEDLVGEDNGAGRSRRHHGDGV